ncbi:MAG TPA: DUF2285 domain-containing protein [Sphingomonas sp.]|jgi:hypothetical protein
MPGEADWRDPGDYEPDEALDWPAIAMGYLARNARYRADRTDALRQVSSGIADAATATRALVDRWGISLPVDPMREPDLRDVIIPPERSPIILTLVSALNPIGPITLPSVGGSGFTMRFDDGDYTILRAANGDHRLWSVNTGVGALALLLPLDVGASVRLAAASRLLRRLTGSVEGPSPLLATPLKLQRHLRLLRLLDGQRAGARARLLASVLIDPQVEGFRAAEWADCRQRKQIGRWTNEANQLMNGGYLTLLNGGSG